MFALFARGVKVIRSKVIDIAGLNAILHRYSLSKPIFLFAEKKKKKESRLDLV